MSRGGNVFNFGTKVHLESEMKWLTLVVKGQRLRSLSLVLIPACFSHVSSRSCCLRGVLESLRPCLREVSSSVQLGLTWLRVNRAVTQLERQCWVLKSRKPQHLLIIHEGSKDKQLVWINQAVNLGLSGQRSDRK